jgi:hypothetical protein
MTARKVSGPHRILVSYRYADLAFLVRRSLLAGLVRPVPVVMGGFSRASRNTRPRISWLTRGRPAGSDTSICV